MYSSKKIAMYNSFPLAQAATLTATKICTFFFPAITAVTKVAQKSKKGTFWEVVHQYCLVLVQEYGQMSKIKETCKNNQLILVEC